MSEWASTKLRELIGRPISGSRPAGGVNTETEGVPSLGGENVLAEGGITFENLNRVPDSFYKAMPKGRLQPFDVLINKDGAQTGKVGLYKGDFPDACVNEHLFILRNQNESNDQRFLFYSVLLPETQTKIARRITGSAQPGLNTTFVDAVDILIPSNPTEQRRIAEILSTLDEAIAQTEALIAKHQQIKAGLMHDLFTRGVTPDGHLRPTREQAPDLYKESPLGWIPKEWGCDYLQNLTLKIVDGVHHTPSYVEHGVPFVTIKNLTASQGIDFKELSYVTLADHREFLKRADPKPGDVLVTKDGTLGVSRIVEPFHPEFSIFVSVAQLRPIATRLRPQMLHSFFDSGFYEQQMGGLSAGSGLKHIHLAHFRRFQIPLPSPNEQDRIAAITFATNERLASEMLLLAKLRQQKHGLMHDLLTGRVRVPEGA